LATAWTNRDGNIAILTALTLPVLLLFASAAVDFQRYNLSRSRLQEFADALAMRGAKELTIAGATAAKIESVVHAAAKSGLAAEFQLSGFSLTAQTDLRAASVSVKLRQTAPKGLLISRAAPFAKGISVQATAVARGAKNVCVVALKDEGDAILAQEHAELDAAPCAILSNSSAVAGIVVKGDALLRSSLICSAGGYEGALSHFSPEPLTDCPTYNDPLAGRIEPPIGPCDHMSFEVGLNPANAPDTAAVSSIVVNPGVYCGGLKILDFAHVQFMPGVYIIKDGPLFVGARSTLTGDNIGFFLDGADSTFTFEQSAEIRMTAPIDGPLAGILFFESRTAPLDRNHSIFSENAHELLGTIYLSRGVLIVDTQAPVADTSAYTALVVRRLELKGGPTLVLNAKYSMTDVPVPSGLGPTGGEIYLRN
jgi:hypothetical protein